MAWIKYTDLDPVRRLRNEGREFLGNRVLATEKRDGSNVPLWLDEDKQVRISSHNQVDAESDIQNRMKVVPEYPKIVDLLNDDYNKNIVLYGELLIVMYKCRGCNHKWITPTNGCPKCGSIQITYISGSPTRIEPPRRYAHWIMFDVYHVNSQRFMPYNWVYQLGYHYKIPVVKIVDDFIPETMDELFAKIEQCKAWCVRHRREGVVLKDYANQVFAKERIDLPKRKKLKQPQDIRVQYPEMPDEKIKRAWEHAVDEVGIENIKDKKIFMPVFARHVATEAREHNYSMPKSIYEYYLNWGNKIG